MKVFEERELTVMLLVDVSGSLEFGTVKQMKKDMVTEIMLHWLFPLFRIMIKSVSSSFRPDRKVYSTQRRDVNIYYISFANCLISVRKVVSTNIQALFGVFLRML